MTGGAVGTRTRGLSGKRGRAGYTKAAGVPGPEDGLKPVSGLPPRRDPVFWSPRTARRARRGERTKCPPVGGDATRRRWDSLAPPQAVRARFAAGDEDSCRPTDARMAFAGHDP